MLTDLVKVERGVEGGGEPVAVVAGRADPGRVARLDGEDRAGGGEVRGVRDAEIK